MVMRVHVEALLEAPCAYVTALWWRVRGKRVRARAQFAPLLAASPHAYQLWLANEPPVAAGLERQSELQIIALVDIGTGGPSGQGGLDATLRSLAGEGIAAFTVRPSSLAETQHDLAAASCRIDWAHGPWLMPLAAGDVLAAGAGSVYRTMATAANPQTAIIYADDDLLDMNGRRITPHFKPAWNSELFRHFDYLTGACIVRALPEDLAALPSGDIELGLRIDWPASLIARMVEAGQGTPVRISQFLHHRRARPLPRIPAPTKAALPASLPPVSVIVPTRNRLDLLRTCLEGLEATDYPELEVIVVDNGSDDPATLAYLDTLDHGRHQVLRHPGPFNFSTLNNRAAQAAHGELLCLLNNDIEVIEPGWLATMVHQAQRPDVGAVGARLFYPDGRIQHAGVVLGICGGAAHAHRLLRAEDEGYFHRHALPQFVSAVTAACLVVRRERFEAVGGLDEENFAVAFNDVDLCMRLNTRGWQSLYEPRASLIHHESVSRGFDRDPVGAARLGRELAALKSAWGTDAGVDPFHHPELNQLSERFVVRL